MVKSFFFWILWILGMSLLYLFGNDTFSRIILAASIIVPLVLIAFAGFAAKKVSAQLILPNALRKGKVMSGRIIFRNGAYALGLRVSCTVMCSNMLTGEMTAKKISTALLPRRDKSIRFSVGLTHCGKLKVTVADFRLHDMFSLSAWKPKTPEEKTVVVPHEMFETHITLIEDINAIVGSETYSMTKPGFDPSEVFAIREYVPGDSIKSIHWKLSQKSDALMVRDFGFPIVNQMLILFEFAFLKEFGVPTPRQTDAMAEVFLSVSGALASQGICHTIGWAYSGVFFSYEISSPAELEAIIEDFFSHTVAENDVTTSGCFRKYHEQCAFSHVIFVSTYVEPDINLLHNGNRITVLRCTADASTEEAYGGDIRQVLFSESNYRVELDNLEL